MVVSIATGIAILLAGCGVVETFHATSRDFGMDATWSVYYYFLVVIAIITCVFRGIPAIGDFMCNKVSAMGGNLLYSVLTTVGIDVLAFASDMNPITGIITSFFIIATFAYFYYRFMASVYEFLS